MGRTSGWARIWSTRVQPGFGRANARVYVRVAKAPAICRSLSFRYDSDEMTDKQALAKLASMSAAFATKIFAR